MVFLSCNSLTSVNAPMSTGNLYDEQKDNERMPLVSTENQRSLLVTLSAQALGSMGLGLSILAIWLRWFIPSSTAPSELPETKAKMSQIKHRRRSAPSRIPPLVRPPIRRATTPLLPSVLKISQEEMSSNRHRRVYFLDSQLPTIKSQHILTSVERLHNEVEALEQLVVQPDVLQPQVDDGLPSSFPSFPTLVTNPTSYVLPSPNLDAREESTGESDSSSRRSSISIRLPKMNNTFLAKARRGPSTADASISSPVPSTSAFFSDESKIIKQSNVGLVPPWSINKARPTTAETLPEDGQTKSSSPSRLSFRRLSGSKRPASPVGSVLLSPPDAAPAPSPSPLTSYFSRKPQRRSSTPVPVRRTSPYEAPYFATPPIPSDASYSAYLRGLPQFGDDMNLKIARTQTSESEHSRGRRSQQANNSAQAVLGLGKPKSLPKRRSASEGWAGARKPQL